MNELLRAIPKVTELYDLPEVSDLREHYASSSVTEWIRTRHRTGLFHAGV